MKIVLGSAFRNSAGRQIDNYLVQANALRNVLAARGDSLFVVAAEGDSTDRTRAELDRLLTVIPGVRVDCSHGGPVFGSTEDPARFRALAGVGNAILSNVPADADVLVYVESDLLWRAEEILSLITALSPEIHVIAPMIWAGAAFYDVFAFRGMDGERFSPFSPYHSSLGEGDFHEISSAGSCLVMWADVARACRVPPEDGLVGFCRDARSRGFRIWLDRAGNVRHP